MMKVSLHGAEFFAYHGFYAEEQLIGNKFMLDIEVEFDPQADLSADQISDTVNYEQLYHIAKKEMEQTRKLLETVVQAVVDRIKADYPQINKIYVELKKLNPPLAGRVAYSSVTITFNK